MFNSNAQLKENVFSMDQARYLVLLFLVTLLVVPAVSIAQANTISNLVGYWHLDEGSGLAIQDSSGNGNSGVVENGATWTLGKLQGALQFDGLNDRVNITTTGGIENMQSFTVSGWVYPTKKGGVIFRKGASTTARFNIFSDANGLLGLRVTHDGSAGSWRAQTPLTLNTWQHVAVGYTYGNVSNDPIFYINGIAKTTQELLTPEGSPASDSSGILLGNNPNATSGFGGKMDALRAYNRTLSAAEIRSIYDLESATKPNIIVIMTDDQEDGPTMDVMTNVKNLIAKEGVTFTNSFVSNSLCCPSRATFLTGQHSQSNGVFFIGNPIFNGKLYTGGYGTLHKTASNTLPVWLQNSGYTTSMFGKYANGYGTQVPETVVPPGWDRWFTRVDGVNGVAEGIRYYNYMVNDDGALKRYGNAPADYNTDVISNKTTAFIQKEEGSEKPFFIYFNPIAPHTGVEFPQNSGPISTPPEPAPRHKGVFANRSLPRPPSFNEADVSDKPTFMQGLTNPLMDASGIAEVENQYRARLESMLAVDDAVKNIIDTLKATGNLDNTVIVYTSDNGFLHGEHRREQGKRLVYEESIRVPLVIRGPGIPKNQTRAHLVSNVDVPATVVDFAKATSGRVLDGRSLASILASYSAPWRSSVFLESSDKLAFIPANDTTLYGIYRAVRTNSYVYAEHEVEGGAIEKEFYDLTKDPYQLESKHDDTSYSSVLTDLASKLHSLINCRGFSCWVTSNEKAPPVASPGVVNVTPPTNGSSPTPIFPTQPYNPFPPVQTPDGQWVQPLSGSAGTQTQTTAQCLNLTRNLYIGTRGADVSALQRFLTDTGDFTYPEITGYYGTVTAKAVQRYQCREMSICSGTPASNGYGVVGPRTRAVISSACSSSTTQTSPIFSGTSAQPSAAICPNIAVNLWIGRNDAETNGAVAGLQKYLRTTGDFTYPEITGYYGTVTAQAVQRYQCRGMSICNGTPASNGYGVVGPRTRATIAQTCAQ